MSDRMNEVLDEVSISILKEHYRTHSTKAHSAKVHMIYVTSTPTPSDAPLAVQVVEHAFAESIRAEALYHEAQARLFEGAIEAIESGGNA
jgi:hypothetical protein